MVKAPSAATASMPQGRLSRATTGELKVLCDIKRTERSRPLNIVKKHQHPRLCPPYGEVSVASCGKLTAYSIRQDNRSNCPRPHRLDLL